MAYDELKRDGTLSSTLSVTAPEGRIPPPSLPTPALETKGLKSERVETWNTADLGLRIGADLSSAATASALVAPLISVIDRSIIQKAAGGASFSSCFLEAVTPVVTRPFNFLASRPFLLVFGLYFSTYFTANTIDTTTSTMKSKPASSVTSGISKFAATSVVNLSACVYKDSQYAKMFGGAATTSSPVAKIPRISYALFSFRDSLTIFASFNLPAIIAPQLANLPPSVQHRFSRVLKTESGRLNAAQFLAPAGMQIFSTPLHLLGLDLFNRQGRLGFSERFARITRDWTVSTFARMGRIVPAFGVGGVVNANMRSRLMKSIQA